jgi:hypothetical protein
VITKPLVALVALSDVTTILPAKQPSLHYNMINIKEQQVFLL